MRVIVRALGPTLCGFGVPNVLADPTLECSALRGPCRSNDNWADIQQTEIQASGLAAHNSVESAVILTKPLPNTIAIECGKNHTAIAVLECWSLKFGLSEGFENRIWSF